MFLHVYNGWIHSHRYMCSIIDLFSTERHGFFFQLFYKNILTFPSLFSAMGEGEPCISRLALLSLGAYGSAGTTLRGCGAITHLPTAPELEGSGHLKDLWTEEETVAPSLCQEGEAGVGFSQRKGSGLLESVKKSLMLLRKLEAEASHLGRNGGSVSWWRQVVWEPKQLALILTGALWSPFELLVPNCYDFWGCAGEEKQEVFGCELKPSIGTTTYRVRLYFLGDLFDNPWQVQSLDPNKTLQSSNSSLRLNNWQRTSLVKERNVPKLLKNLSSSSHLRMRANGKCPGEEGVEPWWARSKQQSTTKAIRKIFTSWWSYLNS